MTTYNGANQVVSAGTPWARIVEGHCVTAAAKSISHLLRQTSLCCPDFAAPAGNSQNAQAVCQYRSESLSLVLERLPAL